MDKIAQRHSFSLQNAPVAWLRFAAPIVTGLLLIWLIIHIMYFGGPRESLVARTESEVLRFSLRNSVYSTGESGKQVIAFSASSTDLKVTKRAPHPALNDAHIMEYAHVLEYVARHNPKWVVMSWLTQAHPMTPEYLEPLTSTIDRLRIHDRVTLALNFFSAGTIDPNFARRYNVFEARDCYHEINLHCSFSPDWSWMPQQILSRFLPEPDKYTSTNLPHHLPNIILNLPDIGSLRQFSFLDARDPVASSIPEGSIVFIGNGAEQDVMFRDNKEVLQRTYVARSITNRSLQADGIPWHIFWASMTTMLLDFKMVQVAPMWFGYLLCLIFFVLILLLAFRKIDRTSIIFFVIIAVGLLSFNLFSVPYFQYYLPVTPIFISCFVTLTSSIFLRIAMNNYRKSRLLATAQKADEARDLKQNFLQLISHNLNTPIAQLRGLLELLAAETPTNTSIGNALLLADFVRITARATLATSAMPTRTPLIQHLNVDDVLGRFLDDESAFLERFGTKVVIGTPADSISHEELIRLKQLDVELVATTILFSILIVTAELESSEVSVTIPSSPSHGQDKDTLHIAIKAVLDKGPAARRINPPPFMLETLNRYLDTAAANNRISIQISQNEALLSIKAGWTPNEANL
jgi:signal transduction histidine kinase